MKHLITESQLKTIINETIKRVLTELHWKTLDSAAQKAKGERARRFAQYRDDIFNSQFGYNVGKSYDDDIADGDGIVVMKDGHLHGGEVNRGKNTRFRSYTKQDDGRYGFGTRGKSSDTCGITQQPQFYSKKVARKFADASNEIDRMRDAKYANGKWQPNPQHQDKDWHDFYDEDDWK